MSHLSDEQREALMDAVDLAENCECCGDDYGWTHLFADFERIVERHRAEAKREALDAVATEWQCGGWTILTAPVPAASNRVIALGNRVTDWLRERAGRMREGGE